MLPAQPLVRVLDLLRAIDGAAIVGDLFAVRALTAAAVRQLEGKAEGDGGGLSDHDWQGQFVNPFAPTTPQKKEDPIEAWDH